MLFILSPFVIVSLLFDVVTNIHLLNLLYSLGILKNMEGIKLNIVTLVNILSYVSVPIVFIIFIFVAWYLFR